ncbi:MAG TPA: sugar ABC transporter substrate-binding protein [Ktedonobacteraceae bacterium]|nr:sugar ABC transporter substrate-binding protein [Ktedonobacteraceae bacterium]
MLESMTRRRFFVETGKAALAVGIGGTALSACGGGTSSSSSSGPVSITYGWWSNGTVKDNAMLAWVQEFEKSHPNIKIKAEILPWANYWTKLQTTVAGGNAYDIVGMAGGMAAPYYDQGALYDLSTLSGYQDAIKNLKQDAVKLCNWNGKQYSLPVGIYVPLLGYNKTLLQQAGVPFPDLVTPMTFDEFMSIGKKLSKQTGGKYTQYAININDLDPLWTALVEMEGGQVYDNPINPKKITLTTPEGIKGLTDWQSLYTQNLNVPFAQQVNGPFGTGDIDSLLTNKVAFARIGAFDFAQIQQQNLQDKIGATPIFSVNGKQVTLGNANSFGVYKGSQHAEAAWEFIKWAISTEPDKTFAKISDVPTDMAAFNQMNAYITPQQYIPTLTSAAKGWGPIVMTPKQQLATDYTNILTDLANGKITPTQAAQQMEQKGNADLNANA